MKIIIRADGGTKIGMGHIMRTSVLAEKLRSFAEIVYVCKTEAEFRSGIEYVAKKGFQTIEISDENMMKRLKEMKGDCLITDSYDVDEGYFTKTKEIFQVTGYIDDLNEQELDVNFIINQNPYAEELQYKTKGHRKLFLGTKYALLREEFLNLPVRKINKVVKDIMITMGGADPYNLTKEICIILHKNYPDMNIHIVLGSAYAYGEDLEKMISERMNVYYSPRMSDIMKQCDIAIAASGSTLYELCACGTPTIGLVIADNQKLAANKMASMGAIKYAQSTENIITCLGDMSYTDRVQMAQIDQSLVDGLGSRRLAEEIKMLLCKTTN